MNTELEEIKSLLLELKEMQSLSCKQIFNVREASLYTGFSEKYIRCLCNNGAISYSQPERSIFIKKKDLDAYMMRNQRKSRYEIEKKANAYIVNH